MHESEYHASKGNEQSSSKRASTGVAGLDEVLRGGLPRNRLYLVQGHPGVGKTTLGLQFLLAGAAAGENVLYITLAESQEELSESARSHGWSLQDVHVHEIPQGRGQEGDAA